MEKFYPDMDIELVAREAKLEIIESNVKIVHINTDEVALYMA